MNVYKQHLNLINPNGCVGVRVLGIFNIVKQLITTFLPTKNTFTPFQNCKCITLNSRPNSKVSSLSYHTKYSRWKKVESWRRSRMLEREVDSHIYNLTLTDLLSAQLRSQTCQWRYTGLIFVYEILYIYE